LIQQLCSLRRIDVQSATVLVREAFVRRFANGKALRSYAGLTATAAQNGNGRTGLAPAALPAWRSTGCLVPRADGIYWSSRPQSDGGGARARKLLIALWRFVTDGVVPAGLRTLRIPGLDPGP